MSNDALITGLSADLGAVRRRSPWREVALLGMVCGAELALFLGFGMMRPDMALMIGTPFMIWKLASLATVAAISGATAILTLSPTVSPRRGISLAIGLSATAIVTGLFLEPANDTVIFYDIIPHSYGPLCALAIVVLSLPVLGGLAVLMRRGAPSHPEGSALAAGLAAGSWGALVFSFCCPSNDPVYVVVWYAAGCALVGGAARWLLPKGFRL